MYFVMDLLMDLVELILDFIFHGAFYRFRHFVYAVLAILFLIWLTSVLY